MDGEVCRAECSPATTAEGHHISISNFTVLDCSSLVLEKYSLLASALLMLGVELVFSVHSFICFMFSLRQTFLLIWKSVGIRRQTWGMPAIQLLMPYTYTPIPPPIMASDLEPCWTGQGLEPFQPSEEGEG